MGNIKRYDLRVQDLKRHPKPKWLRTKLPSRETYGALKSVLKTQDLHTVCTEAFCPNQTECWEARTATFLLMGALCTRHCRFCDVKAGHPQQAIDRDEPKKIAKAVSQLGLKYVVLTSVTRDDLKDGGADHLSQCIQTIRQMTPKVRIEILIPDFQGNREAIQTIVKSNPEVIGHNVECVEVLTPRIRDPKSSFQQSLNVLKTIKSIDPLIRTKSSIMLGVGETEEQILDTLHALRKVKVDIITIGQYLQPTRRHMKVVEYIEPSKFEYWNKKALELGFQSAISGPLVRSSYRAGELFTNQKNRIDAVD